MIFTQLRCSKGFEVCFLKFEFCQGWLKSLCMQNMPVLEDCFFYLSEIARMGFILELWKLNVCCVLNSWVNNAYIHIQRMLGSFSYPPFPLREYNLTTNKLMKWGH